MNSFKRKVLVSFMAMALCVTSVFGTSVTAEAATSKKAVKSVTLKVNNKKVNGKTVQLTQGKSTTVKVTVSPSSAKKSITYKSSNKKIASISTKGKIKGVKAGTATMTVTVKGKNNKTKKATFKVKVVKKATPTKKPTKVPTKKPTAVPTKAVQQPTEMTLEASATAIAPGQTSQLYPKFVPAGTSTKVSYKSSNTTVATVDANGTVKGLTEGTATIVATTANNLSATLTIKVAKVAPTSMKLNVSTLTMTIGEGNQTLSAQFPEGTTQTEVTWKSSDETVVSVDATGKLVAKKAGKATITATSVADPSITATCDVTVKSETNTRTDGVTIEVANALNGYENTVFTGNNADIRVRLYKDAKPVANTDVTLKMEYKSGTGNYWEISNEHSASSTVKTDAQGIATFTIALKNGYNYKANDGVMGGYLLTATATGASTKAQTALRFARFTVGEYKGRVATENYSFANITVNGLLTNLVQGENAAEEKLDEKQVVERKQINTDKVNNELIGTSEYVVSQQVSTEGTVDHAVTFNAAPLIEYPEVITGTSDDDYKQEVNYSTKGYSIYDTSKSTVIREVPTNLNYATLNFANVTISKNTALKIEVYRDYDETTDTLLGKLDDYVYAIKGEHVEDNFGFQVPIQELAKKADDYVYIKVYVESQGQVEVAKAIGFDLVNITGNYVGTAKYKNLSELYKDAKINWTSVTTGKIGQDAYKYANFQNSVTMKAGNNKKAKTDEENINTAYGYGIDTVSSNSPYYNATVTYRVPTYPHLGNAIVTVKKQNANEIDTYFMIPTYADNNENKLIDSTKVQAFNVSKEEATNYGVGVQVTSTDYTVTLNSEISGVSEVYGELEVGSELDYLTMEQKRLFAYVEWAPLPKEKVKPTTDFYALVGQTISVDVLVKDENGNKVRDKEVEFYLGDDKTEKLTRASLPEGVSITADSTKYDETNSTVKTNADGVATITFKSDSYKSGIIAEPLFPKCEGYKVTMSVKGTVAEYARLYWIAPGLSFTDQTAVEAEETKDNIAQKATKTITYELGNKDTKQTETQTKNIDTTWLVGYQVVGLVEDKVKADAATAAKEGYSNVIIEGADTGVTLLGSGVDEPYGKIVEGTLDTKKACAQITSVKTGLDILRGTLSRDTIDEKAVMNFTLLDSLGNVIKTVPNVGDGETSASVGLNVPIKWAPVNMQYVIDTPSGYDITVDENIAGKQETVYVKVFDNKNNMLDDYEVKYSVKDSSTGEYVKLAGQKVAGEASGVSKKGYVAINYTIPNKTCTYDVTATIEGYGSVTKSINYKTRTATTADFGMKLATGALENGMIKIAVKLSEDVNADTVVKEMFEIRDEAGVKYTINSFSVDGSVITMTVNPGTFKYLNITYNAVKEDLAKGVVARRMSSKNTKVAMKDGYVISGYYNPGVEYEYTKGTVKAKVATDLYEGSYVVFAYGDKADALNNLESVAVASGKATSAKAAKAKFVKVYVAGEESEVYENKTTE